MVICLKPQKAAHVAVCWGKCVEEDKHIFKNTVLMNRIHKCRTVDILTETQYIEMYERMRNKQIEACNTYMEIKMILSLGIKGNK